MKDAQNTPILFLIFNRPDTTAKVFEAITRAKPRRLFVAADGPRAKKEGDAEKCKAAREIITRVDWDCEVKTLFREQNLGCKEAVSSAINWFFEHVEEGVILEDDCLPSDSFFSFCTELLEKYRNDERIMMISGDNFQDGIQRGDASYYFSRIPHIWGWATWRRAWQLYDKEMKSLPAFIQRKAIQRVSPDVDVQNYWLSCYIETYQGIIGTWDYQWFLAIHGHDGLCICPQSNMISNIGFGEDATHTNGCNSKLSELARFDIAVISHSEQVVADESADVYEYANQLNISCRSIANPLLRWRKRLSRRMRAKRKINSFGKRHIQIVSD
jgi:hypothetical protein